MMPLNQDLVATLVILVAAIPSVTPFNNSFIDCMHSNGVPEVEVIPYLGGEEATEGLKHVFKCQADFYNVLVDGRIDIKKLISIFPPAAHYIAEKCGCAANDAPDANVYEVSKIFHQCFRDTDLQLYINLEEA